MPDSKVWGATLNPLAAPDDNIYIDCLYCATPLPLGHGHGRLYCDERCRGYYRRRGAKPLTAKAEDRDPANPYGPDTEVARVIAARRSHTFEGRLRLVDRYVDDLSEVLFRASALRNSHRFADAAREFHNAVVLTEAIQAEIQPLHQMAKRAAN